MNEKNIGLDVKYPLFLSDFYKIWSISTEFREILTYKIVLNFIQWEPSRSIRTYGQTDMTMVKVVFRNFVKSA